MCTARCRELRNTHARLERAINRQNLSYDESRFRISHDGPLVYIVRWYRDDSIPMAIILHAINASQDPNAPPRAIERGTCRVSNLRALNSEEQEWLEFEEDAS